MTPKTCGVCNGHCAGGGLHTQWDCIDHLKKEMKIIRAETIRELDKKYNTYCQEKVNAAIAHMEKALEIAMSTNEFNMASIRMGRARNEKLEILREAVSYCYRNGHIESAAVIYTGLDKALEAADGGPTRKFEPRRNPDEQSPNN